jgi:hypothetical protein
MNGMSRVCGALNSPLLFDNRDHALKVFANGKGPKRLVTIPGIQHYGIHFNKEARQRSNDLALEWCGRYLKNEPK